jgi:ATP-dependent Clp protease ATP-binding subunit ClpB
MYIVLKSGAFLHPNIGIYERLDVATAFAVKALSFERDSYHSYSIFSRVPEDSVHYSGAVVVLTKRFGKIIVDRYDEGGQLTEAVRRKPYSVILLDEIEKAHPDTFNILLQVLDEGRLTDNKGRLADFKNTIIIMTSNMGSQIIQDKFENLKGSIDAATEAAKIEVLGLLKQTVRPEFINRIDEIVMFTPLTSANIAQIVSFQLKSVTKMLAQQGIVMDATPEAIVYLSEKGYDPQFGARPVKRVIQREVLNELSKEILSGKITADSIILIDAFDGKLVFRNQSQLVS